MSDQRQKRLQELYYAISVACTGSEVGDAIEVMEVLKAEMVVQARTYMFAYRGNLPPDAADKDKH